LNEIYCVALLCVFVFFYNYGSKVNKQILNKWLEINQKYYDQQFSVVGIKDDSGNLQTYEQDSKNVFKFYASGRNNCSYVLVNIETKKRHDLLAMTVFNLVWPQYDKISFEIPLVTDKLLPVCLGVCRKKNVKSVLTDNSDLKYLCKKFTVEGIPNTITVLAENEEIIEYIFDKN